jgi:hypothetical protein
MFFAGQTCAQMPHLVQRWSTLNTMDRRIASVYTATSRLSSLDERLK